MPSCYVDNPTPSSEDHLNAIQRNGHFLVHLVTDLMEVAQINDDATQEIHVGTEALIKEAIAVVQPEAEIISKRISCEIAPGTPSLISGQAHRIRQTLCNVIQSAMYLPGDELIVSTRYVDEDKTLLVCISNQFGGWTGIARRFEFDPEQDLELHDDPTRNATCLYYRIAEQLVSRLDGSLQLVENDDGQFFIQLKVPTMPVNTCLPADLSSKTDCRLDGVRILIVEDGIDNQRIFRRFLEAAGGDVNTADNGQIGCDMVQSASAEETPYDVILMDMQMPVLDGYGATRQLRSTGFDLPIIAITAYAMEHDRNKCLDAGCSSYITKPVRKDELLQIVRSQADCRAEMATTV
jgi:two-component system CheB/CheR fusion protein